METASLSSMALAAGAAACISEAVTLPVDTVKVRMQVRNTGLGCFSYLARMLRQEGLHSWFRGLQFGLQRQAVYASLRISLYPHIRDFYCERAPEATPQLALKILAGMSSGSLAMCVANPAEVVKIRLQAASDVSRPITFQKGVVQRKWTSKATSSSTPSSTFAAYNLIYREEGLRGMFRGLLPNVIRCGLICSAEVVSYDEFKRAATRVLGDTTPTYLIAGFGAGLVATCVGSPVDVLKTRYQNARPGDRKNMARIVSELYRSAGLLGFYKG